MEKTVEAKAIIIEQICDVCEEGKMEYTGRTYMVHPPSHQHQCNFCNHQDSYKKTYPSKEIVPKNEE